MLKSVEQPCDSRVISISIQDKSLDISFLCFQSYRCRTSKSRADVPFVILLFSTDWNLSRKLVYFPWDSVHPFPILTPSQALILDKWDLFFKCKHHGLTVDAHWKWESRWSTERKSKMGRVPEEKHKNSQRYERKARRSGAMAFRGGEQSMERGSIPSWTWETSFKEDVKRDQWISRL